MRYICDAPNGRTWFRIETEAEAVGESETMRHAVEKYFRKERDLGQPEIENLRLTSICDEDIRGPDVPVNDVLGMSGIKRVRDLDSQIEHCLDFQRLAIDPMPEGLTFEQFHRDEGSPLGVIDFVDGADVRVVQGGRSFGLALKTAEGLCVVGEFVGKELQGNVATELEVFCLVHDTHPPAADLAEDAVMGNRLPHGLGGRGH